MMLVMARPSAHLLCCCSDTHLAAPDELAIQLADGPLRFLRPKTNGETDQHSRPRQGQRVRPFGDQPVKGMAKIEREGGRLTSTD